MTNKDFRFLGGKIEQLSTALFVNYRMAPQKFPVSLLRTVKMDEAGKITVDELKGLVSFHILMAQSFHIRRRALD